MDPSIIRTLVQVESNKDKIPTPPKRVLSQTQSARVRQDALELQSLPPPYAEGNSPEGPSRETDVDLEMSRPATPTNPQGAQGVVVSQNIPDSPMNKYRLASCCLMNLLNGLNDAAPGALVPYMETYYNIGYATVSLIFIGNALGFIMAAPWIHSIQAGLGRGKMLVLSQTLMVMGYIPIICTAPFPVIVICFFLTGFGMSLNLAIGNVFCANQKQGATALGFMHGSYGVGGTISPLMATAIVTTTQTVWSRFYLIPLGLAVFNLLSAPWAFWNYEKESAASGPMSDTSRRATNASALVRALKSKIVVLGALFIFAYQGAEVSISGWVISFLIQDRNGDPSAVGYVTSGFWAGITIGRFALSPLGIRIGEKRFVYGVVIGAAIFELLVWQVPNVIGNAVSLAIVGLLLGPVYPCAAHVFTRNLNRDEQTSGLGVISAFGSSGGAVAPFTTGVIAQAAGPFVLHPIAIGLFVAMLGCWYGIPAIRKRTE